MKSNKEEFATYSIFMLFIFPLWANVTIPQNELFAANCISQANGSSWFHTVVPSLARPIWQLISSEQTGNGQVAMNNPQPHPEKTKPPRIQTGLLLNNVMSIAHLQSERIGLLPVSLKEDL